MNREGKVNCVEAEDKLEMGTTSSVQIPRKQTGPHGSKGDCCGSLSVTLCQSLHYYCMYFYVAAFMSKTNFPWDKYRSLESWNYDAVLTYSFCVPRTCILVLYSSRFEESI